MGSVSVIDPLWPPTIAARLHGDISADDARRCSPLDQFLDALIRLSC